MICQNCGCSMEFPVVDWGTVLYRTRCPSCGREANVHPRYAECHNCGNKIRLELDLLYCPHCGHQELI